MLNGDKFDVAVRNEKEEIKKDARKNKKLLASTHSEVRIEAVPNRTTDS